MELEDDRFDTPHNTKKIWKIDPNACMAISDEEPTDVLYYNDGVVHERHKEMDFKYLE